MKPPRPLVGADNVSTSYPRSLAEVTEARVKLLKSNFKVKGACAKKSQSDSRVEEVRVQPDPA